MGHALEVLGLNAVDWDLWLRLDDLTRSDHDLPLLETLRGLRFHLPDEHQEELTEAPVRFDSLVKADLPALLPMQAARALRVDPERFAPILVSLLREREEDRPHIRGEIMQLAFPSAFHRTWPEWVVSEPLLLLAALVPPLREEVMGRLPPVDGMAVFGFREIQPSDLHPRSMTPDADSVEAAAMGIVRPLPPRPFAPVESRTLSPRDVAEVAARLATSSWSVHLDDDPDFAQFIAERRYRPEDRDSPPLTGADVLRRSLSVLRQAFADTAARGLGLDLHYFSQP